LRGQCSDRRHRSPIKKPKRPKGKETIRIGMATQLPTPPMEPKSRWPEVASYTSPAHPQIALIVYRDSRELAAEQEQTLQGRKHQPAITKSTNPASLRRTDSRRLRWSQQHAREPVESPALATIYYAMHTAAPAPQGSLVWLDRSWFQFPTLGPDRPRVPD
jgi:hypothetical protein